MKPKTYYCYADLRLVAIVTTKVSETKILRWLERAYLDAMSLDVARERINWRSPWTVYVVTKGTYSNYGIVGVFSDRGRAERCASALEGTQDGAEIEVYELDAIDIPGRCLG